jgi:hypothetical protein
MKMTIVSTTDKQHLGKEFNSQDNPIVLEDGFMVNVDRTLELTDGMRFISSNYIIDGKGV